MSSRTTANCAIGLIKRKNSDTNGRQWSSPLLGLEQYGSFELLAHRHCMGPGGNYLPGLTRYRPSPLLLCPIDQSDIAEGNLLTLVGPTASRKRTLAESREL